MKKDIENNQVDIKLLVDTFYDKVRANELLGRIFDDVAKVNWETHLPKMYGFWENILFQTGGYKGAPFLPHLKVNAMESLTPKHFNEWMDLFLANVDEHFEGPMTEELKRKAFNIKEVWSYKMNYINEQYAAERAKESQ